MKIKAQKSTGMLLILLRVLVVILLILAMVPQVNPTRISELINKNSAMLTTALSSKSLLSEFSRQLRRGWIEEGTLNLVYLSSLLTVVSMVVAGAGWCMSLGEKRLKKLGTLIITIACIVGMLSLLIILPAYQAISTSEHAERLKPLYPDGLWIVMIAFGLCFITALFSYLRLPKAEADEGYEMKAKYKLFLMILPFVILCFMFAYLPLWGWRYALFDYKPGRELSADNFVAFKWFTFLFKNSATRADIVRVVKNTLAMSGLGLAFSWLPMAFAIFLSEIKASRVSRLVQTFTTIPNFISWVLVYSVAFALFSTEGFVNSILISLGVIDSGVNYLMSGENIWLKMWAWGTWKGLGWSAIIYIAGISSIDGQLYEAATIDGAGRFKRMWYITVPGLLPTFFVLLLLAVAGILSNGMDQYFVFQNSANKSTIEVLDLYVYTLGLGSGGSGNIPLATAVGMMKSIISVTLLFLANGASKLIRGESIV